MPCLRLSWRMPVLESLEMQTEEKKSYNRKGKKKRMSIKIENIIPPSVSQWEAVIRGMRNPMNSWAKSDSTWDMIEDPSPINPDDMVYIKIGEADLDLMRRLAKAGSDHRKYLRQLPVIMDVTAPLFFWKEEDQYKVGTVTNSCSTMHTIHISELTLDDFSMETCRDLETQARARLFGLRPYLGMTIDMLNKVRKAYVDTKDEVYWRYLIELLPSSFNQKRTLSCNYEVLWNMYQARKGHKLKEWREFCQTIVREVPYFAEIFQIEEEKK